MNADEVVNPTKETYDALNIAYEFFNRRLPLFNGQLPRCLITMQRKGRTRGFFAKQQFVRREGDVTTDEIALNPQHFRERTTELILSTLVHEMVHQYEWHIGNAGRHGYHDKKWAASMKQVGLYPSNTGEPGGRETGQQVTHYILRGGPFDVACAELLQSGFDISYVEVECDKKKRKAKAESKTKYTCPQCGLNAWAKLDVSLLCIECEVPLQRAGARRDSGRGAVPIYAGKST